MEGKSVKRAAVLAGLRESKPMSEATKQLLREQAAEKKALRPKRKQRRRKKKR